MGAAASSVKEGRKEGRKDLWKSPSITPQGVHSKLMGCAVPGTWRFASLCLRSLPLWLRLSCRRLLWMVRAPPGDCLQKTLSCPSPCPCPGPCPSPGTQNQESRIKSPGPRISSESLLIYWATYLTLQTLNLWVQKASKKNRNWKCSTGECNTAKILDPSVWKPMSLARRLKKINNESPNNETSAHLILRTLSTRRQLQNIDDTTI